jgi:hypothetical protein
MAHVHTTNKIFIMKKIFIAEFVLSVLIMTGCKVESQNGEWQNIFDGKTLEGWTKSEENSGSITVDNGAIKCSGPRAHLYYDGAFENFEFEATVKTDKLSNSGIFFHTQYEVQINNSYPGTDDYRESRKTGSIYNIRNIYYPLVKDEEWFKVRIRVVENHVEVFVNDQKVNDYVEPVNPWRWDGGEDVKLGKGTFALQGHDAGRSVWFKDIRVKKVAASEPAEMKVSEKWDTALTRLMAEGFPVVDYHVHLKGGLTLDQVVENSQRLGINYGIAPNCGLYFPVTNDSSLYAYIAEVAGSPTFKGMQAEGREWVTLFSPEAIARFDYVFTDAMTFTDNKGRRNRIWMPEEVWVEDKQQFMDQLVEKIEAIFSQEPVDIYVNPTVLPKVIADEYDALWTQSRKQRVVDVLAQNGIALEINARYELPKADMIKMAKAAGVKFTFGTNNTGDELGRLEYCLKMIEACELTPEDMFEIKDDSEKPINTKGLPDEITG